jgi:putative salt-induced outer membrane protein YdiY
LRGRASGRRSVRLISYIFFQNDVDACRFAAGCVLLVHINFYGVLAMNKCVLNLVVCMGVAAFAVGGATDVFADGYKRVWGQGVVFDDMPHDVSYQAYDRAQNTGSERYASVDDVYRQAARAVPVQAEPTYYIAPSYEQPAAQPIVARASDVIEAVEPAAGGFGSVEALDWSGRVDFGGFVTDGNTKKKAVVIDGEVKARDELNRYQAGAEIRYADDNGEETEDEYQVYIGYDRFLSEKMFVGGRASYEADDIAELDSRIQIGPYVGYQYFERDDLNLSTQLGAEYITSEFASGDTEDNIAASWGLDYDQKVLDESLQLFYDHDLSVPFDETDAFLFESNMGVRFPIAKILTGTAQVDFDWDNDPPAGVRENDTKYSLKLGYEFD